MLRALGRRHRPRLKRTEDPVQTLALWDSQRSTMPPSTRLLAALWLVTSCTPQVTPAPAPNPSPAAPTVTAPAVRYGPIMTAVGHHHELAGRAIAAGRWELAGYAVRELREELASLATATPPEEATGNITPIAVAFPEAVLPPLERALAARDAVAARAAFGTVSTACNGCHMSAGFGFLLVPTEPGAAVPDVTPATPVAPTTPTPTPSPDAAVVADAASPHDAPPRPLPGAGGACDDRVGCAHGLVCCTHGGIPMPATHHGRCMTFRGCNTIPAAPPRGAVQ